MSMISLGRRVAILAGVTLGIISTPCVYIANAQEVAHRFFRMDAPPGMLSQAAMMRAADRWNYVQPVEVRVPSAADVAIVEQGSFSQSAMPLRVGLQLGQCYRLRVANIPRHEEIALYPSIELIDRLHPPRDVVDRFPVVVEITQDDLEQALRGHLVVRVIYIENPQRAWPEDDRSALLTMDVRADEDPLHVADLQGRPIAILRLGSLQLEEAAGVTCHDFGSPPVTWTPDVPAPVINSGELASAPALPCPDAPPSCTCDPSSEESTDDWADEYLCDGGDQLGRVRVITKGQDRDEELRGLDIEDTVGHYRTADGRTLVNPSNRVCLYSPRFAAVRKVVLTSEDDRVLAMQEVELPDPSVTLASHNDPNQLLQPLPPRVETGLRGPLALGHRVHGVPLWNYHRVAEIAKDVNAQEDLQVVATGIHRRSQRTAVEEQNEAALVWTDALAPEVIFDEQPATVEVTAEKIGTVHHLDERHTPCLRVIKLASTRSASPGEEVEFTLRFDNVGDQPIERVTIVDSLTARLKYVDKSAACDREARFATDPNESESLVLRWEIDEPIKVGEGGIIRFRCRVR